MPASCSSGRPSPSWWRCSHLRATHALYIGPTSIPWARPFISAANLSNHSLLFETSSFLGSQLCLIAICSPDCRDIGQQACVSNMVISRRDVSGNLFRHHYTPGNVGNPCYGEACVRGTGRVLPQAMALQQIVGSREEAVGERQVRKKASRQYQTRYKCWRRRWKKLFAPWSGVSRAFVYHGQGSISANDTSEMAVYPCFRAESSELTVDLRFPRTQS